MLAKDAHPLDGILIQLADQYYSEHAKKTVSNWCAHFYDKNNNSDKVVLHGPLAKSRGRMRRECRERFPRHRR